MFLFCDVTHNQRYQPVIPIHHLPMFFILPGLWRWLAPTPDAKSLPHVLLLLTCYLGWFGYVQSKITQDWVQKSVYRLFSCLIWRAEQLQYLKFTEICNSADNMSDPFHTVQIPLIFSFDVKYIIAKSGVLTSFVYAILCMTAVETHHRVSPLLLKPVVFRKNWTVL